MTIINLRMDLSAACAAEDWALAWSACLALAQQPELDSETQSHYRRKGQYYAELWAQSQAICL